MLKSYGFFTRDKQKHKQNTQTQLALFVRILFQKKIKTH